MSRIITCEQVSNGHPDKICDQIADAIVTDCLQHDPKSRVAIEVLIKDNHIIIAGELTSEHKPDYKALVYQVFERIGMQKLDYGKSVDFRDSFFLGPDIGILVKEQSPDIALGVDKGGAGDQGMMMGYATNETAELLPIPFVVATRFLQILKAIRAACSAPMRKPRSASTTTAGRSRPSSAPSSTARMWSLRISAISSKASWYWPPVRTG